MRNQSEFVFPGDELGAIEELSTGEGTYEENGTVRAAVVGTTFIDMINRRGNVINQKKPGLLALKKAKHVYFLVEQLREDVALGTIVGIDEKPVQSHLSAFVHISQIINTRVERISDYLRPGDIVKAKVLAPFIPVPLTIKQRDLGVVYARCSRCGAEMRQADEEHLRCPVCKNVETRKLPEVRGTWRSR